jgi:hypothetical protein
MRDMKPHNTFTTYKERTQRNSVTRRTITHSRPTNNSTKAKHNTCAKGLRARHLTIPCLWTAVPAWTLRARWRAAAKGQPTSKRSAKCVCGVRVFVCACGVLWCACVCVCVCVWMKKKTKKWRSAFQTSFDQSFLPSKNNS